ncbi:hypothetical protein OHC33_010599 [Knufia fluminis]|uniref:Uncharacterized protein n=1 Tax=Knufia fluminis TaxID=191047 RepID=A0AAN8I3G4_9EURO|nr:hypothetical protein OHC33_010599 [Knufia fluminis]
MSKRSFGEMTEERAAESHEDKFVDMEEPESEANDKSDDNGIDTRPDSEHDDLSAQHKRQTTPTSVLFTAAMFARTGIVAEKRAILAELLSPETQSLLLHIGTRRITTTELGIIHSLVSSMSPTSDLRDALFYLEAYDWNLSTARIQHTADELDRNTPYTDATGNVPTLAQYNASLDRSLATAPLPHEEDTERVKHNDFDTGKLAITVNLTAPRPKQVNQVTYKYPGHATFNWRNQSHLDDLNNWRRRIFREHVGPSRDRLIAPATQTRTI